MEEQNEKKNGNINYGVIAIAIIASIFIVIKICTKYMEKKTSEEIERILEKNPDFFNQLNEDKQQDKEIKWKAFSNNILSFEYPETYDVETEEANGMHQIICTPKSNYELCTITITYGINCDLLALSDDDIERGCEGGLREVQQSMRSECTNMSFSEAENTYMGKLKGKSMSYTGELYGLYNIKGRIFIAFYKDKMFTFIYLFEYERQKNQIDRIIKTITIK